VTQLSYSSREGENVAIPGERRRILCVDDELMLAELCEERLQALGYEVIGETDAQRAFWLFEENPEGFDLLILDHIMPKVSGMALAKGALALRPDLPVLLVTGHEGAVSGEEAKEAGVKEVITKPFTTPELEEAIKRVLG
jgi:two-component system, cell cycle sensor histidine kinase and response regulator CckA